MQKPTEKSLKGHYIFNEFFSQHWSAKTYRQHCTTCTYDFNIRHHISVQYFTSQKVIMGLLMIILSLLTRAMNIQDYEY